MNVTAKLFVLLVSLAALVACGGPARTVGTDARATDRRAARSAARESRGDAPAPYSGKVIHVIVALCDNVNQGIVPVSASLGNGEDPARNLYWGARFGVKSFFGRSKDWQLVSAAKGPRPWILERLVYRHRRVDAYLVADAYRGAEIRQATADFLAGASGTSRETFDVGGQSRGLASGAAAHLVAYVGHNGLMDFALAEHPRGRDDARRGAVVLACASKSYFAAPLRAAGANPLLWTTNLMAPEAHVLDAAIEGWLAGEAGEGVRLRAAVAYDAYQRCGARAARRLFASGW